MRGGSEGEEDDCRQYGVDDRETKPRREEESGSKQPEPTGNRPKVAPSPLRKLKLAPVRSGRLGAGAFLSLFFFSDGG